MQDDSGKTALIYSVYSSKRGVMSNFLNIARQLIDHGANVDIADGESNSALEYARRTSNKEFMELLGNRNNMKDTTKIQEEKI